MVGRLKNMGHRHCHDPASADGIHRFLRLIYCPRSTAPNDDLVLGLRKLGICTRCLAGAPSHTQNRNHRRFRCIHASRSRIRLTLFSVKSLLPLFMVTQLAVAAIFSPFFVFQGYPFYRLWRQPRIGFAILLLSIAAGLGITALPQNIHTLVTSLLSGVLLWSVLFSWSFAYPLTRKYGQPKRGLLTLPLVFVIAVAWSYSVSMVLPTPKSLWLSLYVVLPAFIIHNIFWFRIPFSPPLLLGMPPRQHKSLDKLFDWFSQIRD